MTLLDSNAADRHFYVLQQFVYARVRQIDSTSHVNWTPSPTANHLTSRSTKYNEPMSWQYVCSWHVALMTVSVSGTVFSSLPENLPSASHHYWRLVSIRFLCKLQRHTCLFSCVNASPTPYIRISFLSSNSWWYPFASHDLYIYPFEW